MSGESSNRSNLIDVTYQHLHSILSDQRDGTTQTQLIDHLTPRLPRLGSISCPFGKQSDESRKKIDSGSVTLPDGVLIRVETPDRPFVFAISDRFNIDQVEALVLLRSFLYNEGLPSNITAEAISGSSSGKDPMVEELLEAITPFYYSECLHILRVLLPLFRANENTTDSLHTVSTTILPKLIPDPRKFAESIVETYASKTTATVPENLSDNPRTASRWAKQNIKEQLVLLELLFWAMWSYVSCQGLLVVKILECAYNTKLGSAQQNSTLLLDEEGVQIQEDCAAMWILVTVEVLELETIAERSSAEIFGGNPERDIFTSNVECLERLHVLVTSHGNSQYACIYLAWAFILSRLVAAATGTKEIPDAFKPFFETHNLFGGLLGSNQRFSKANNEPLHLLMVKTCLEPGVGLFQLILTLLTTSPLFVTTEAWRKGSAVTDPNAIAFRSVLKGLIIALVELVPVELIPDFDSLVQVWVALFGRSEPSSVAGICAQFWQADWPHGIARRAIIDVARSRFPIHFPPLIRLLRAMTGSGFLDTDPLSPYDVDHLPSPSSAAGIQEERDFCARHVFYYFDSLPTFSQVIPLSSCSGSHALYEKQQERASNSGGTGLRYTNIRHIRLPGGSVLPAGTTGRLLSGDGGDLVVVCWQHEHSGWKVILELLTEYVSRKNIHSGLVFGGIGSGIRKQNDQKRSPLSLRLGDVGLEMDRNADTVNDDEMITDALDLIRSLIQDNPAQAEQLMQALEAGDPVVAYTTTKTMTDTQPPDLVQLTTMILEDAMTRNTPNASASTPMRGVAHARLITSAMSVLSALLVLPGYSNRVWLYVRSSTALFSPKGDFNRTAVFSEVALAAERVYGQYTMTLALLHLVQELFLEAARTVLVCNPKLQQVKEEVLLRAVRFVHTEIWVEHLGWRYVRSSERFEIGRRIAQLYGEVLRQSPPVAGRNDTKRPFALLSRAITDVLLFNATTSTVSPLLQAISSGHHLLGRLYEARRFGDARRLIFLVQESLRLTRQVLVLKQKLATGSQPCLLEQLLCSRIPGMQDAVSSSLSVSSLDRYRRQANSVTVDPIDILASYVKEREAGTVVPLEAMHVLQSLCISLASSVSPASTMTMIGHLSNPEATIASLVRIVQHPYDDLTLRKAVWTFISFAVDKEPAMANLFVTGRFHAHGDLKGKEKEANNEKVNDASHKASTPPSAIDVARDVLSNRREMWEVNPQLLASVMRFLHVVWQHGLEHKAVLEPIRKDNAFWEQVVSLACEESSPTPDYQTESYVILDGVKHSSLDEGISTHAYRLAIKSYAVHIICLDIGMHLQLQGHASPPSKPLSFVRIEKELKNEEHLTDLLSEASSNSYEPHLHDELLEQFNADFPGLAPDLLERQEPVDDREYGDNFTFSTALLQSRLQVYHSNADEGMLSKIDAAERQLFSINLNLSLTHAQSALADSWQRLLKQVGPYLRGEPTTRQILLNIAASVSYNIANEQRLGDMMATIHGTRLSLLLAITELAWFSPSDKPTEIKSFIELVRNVHGIILNEAQSPAKSFLGSLTNPFHRTLLQIIYFCARQSRSLLRRPKAVNADQRLLITSMIEATLTFIIDSLRIVFETACSRADPDLDRDMELLVAVFEQCTRHDISPSSTLWLAKCQETDVIKASLNLFTHIDLVGLSDMPFLLARKRPLYMVHVLSFHMSLASIPSAASKLASDGVLTAYSNNSIGQAASRGAIDVILSELPGERSPAHRAYCSMLSIVSGVTIALGHQNPYFHEEVSGLIQLFGEQISRALAWTINDPFTFPLLEEIEQVVHLFYALAENSPHPSSGSNTHTVMQKVLRGFSSRSLLLLQQLNSAITHPNHLASLLEPVSSDERMRLEKEGASSSAEPLKRPLIARLMYRFFRLSSDILGTLVSISRADEVLTREQEHWPVHEALILPHSKIVLGEPASMGTLLEMGNSTLDVLRELVGHPAGQSIIPTSSSNLPSFNSSVDGLDVRQGVETARRNLEAVLFYAVTQLTMWLSKPELFDMGAEGGGDGEHSDERMQAGDLHSHPSWMMLDPHAHSKEREKDGTRDRDRDRRHAGWPSMSLAERLRRGMTGEMAADLQSLLGKAKPVIAKSDAILGGEGAGARRIVDVTQTLSAFLQQRVGTPS